LGHAWGRARFPVTDKLIHDKGFQRFQPMLENSLFCNWRDSQMASLTHGPEDVQGV
jgi:hypothetical protein